MLNLIKADIYRLFHTKSYKVGLVFSALISFLVVAGVAALLAILKGMLEGANVAADGENMNVLAIIFPVLSWLDEGVTIDTVITFVLSIGSLLISTIVTATFVNSEQTSGYIKNIAGQVSSKAMLIFSKVVTIAVVNLSIFVVYSIFSTLAAVIFLSSILKMGNMLPFLGIIGAKFLLFMAIDAIILFLCTLTKSKSFAISIGTIYGIGAVGMVYNMVNTVISMYLKNIKFNLEMFTPDGMDSKLFLSVDSGTIIRSVVVAVIYLIVFTMASCFLMKKRDVK